jgi:hypothetical protein
MPSIATTRSAANSLHQADLFTSDSLRSFDLNANIRRFDLHEIRLPSAQQEIRLGAVYTTEDEMRYGPRLVDQAEIEDIRALVAGRAGLPASPVRLK